MELIFDPEKLRAGRLYKVVQINIDGEHQILFAEHVKGLLHSMILRNFLKSRNISYAEIYTGNGFGPVTCGPRYAVVGMGGAQLLSKNRIKFFGDSVGYGLPISDTHLDWFREKYPDWKFIAESPL